MNDSPQPFVVAGQTMRRNERSENVGEKLLSLSQPPPASASGAVELHRRRTVQSRRRRRRRPLVNVLFDQLSDLASVERTSQDARPTAPPPIDEGRETGLTSVPVWCFVFAAAAAADVCAAVAVHCDPRPAFLARASPVVDAPEVGVVESIGGMANDKIVESRVVGGQKAPPGGRETRRTPAVDDDQLDTERSQTIENTSRYSPIVFVIVAALLRRRCRPVRR